MNIRKENSSTVHHGFLPASQTNTYYGKPTWCGTSGWKDKWVEHVGEIKLPYRKCKICFRGEK